MWKLKQHTPRTRVKDESKGNQKYLEINENGNTTTKTQVEATAVVKGKLMVIMPTLRKKKDL